MPASERQPLPRDPSRGAHVTVHMQRAAYAAACVRAAAALASPTALRADRAACATLYGAYASAANTVAMLCNLYVLR